MPSNDLRQRHSAGTEEKVDPEDQSKNREVVWGKTPGGKGKTPTYIRSLTYIT